jgi:hypothetical protein
MPAILCLRERVKPLHGAAEQAARLVKVAALRTERKGGREQCATSARRSGASGAQQCCKSLPRKARAAGWLARACLICARTMSSRSRLSCETKSPIWIVISLSWETYASRGSGWGARREGCALWRCGGWTRCGRAARGSLARLAWLVWAHLVVEQVDVLVVLALHELRVVGCTHGG